MANERRELPSDGRAKLRTLLAALGEPQLAELLDTDRESIREVLRDPTRAEDVDRRIEDAHYVVSRASPVFVGKAVRDWLFGHSVAFYGARPIDVLKTDGPARLIDELARISDGGYA